MHQVISLVFLIIFVGVLGAISFATYSVVKGVSKSTSEKMERHNFSISKEGMKVHVREIQDEEYRDRNQSVLVKMWNNTSFPAYKSRLWNMTGPSDRWTNGAEKRK
ncbi:hypothetical protein N7495_008152, partial [Penicillium taxi]|uniref:uncharacterized protein n=1 Tax=Penicillium taxi TaxID=168475 RepID=UPI002545106A